MRRKLLTMLAVAGALGIAAPALAGDAHDTAVEKKSEVQRKARGLEGHETASDRAKDAKDWSKEQAAKGRKSARHAGRKLKHQTKSSSQRARG